MKRPVILGTVGVVLLAVGFVLWARMTGLTAITIHGSAMSPALVDGDTALGIPLAADEALERGQVVGFRAPDGATSIVGRIVGLPGEWIAIVRGQVAIDGEPILEPYVAEPNRSSTSMPPLEVPPDSYFILGDNRRSSADSRMFGSVARSRIWVSVRTIGW